LSITFTSSHGNNLVPFPLNIAYNSVYFVIGVFSISKVSPFLSTNLLNNGSDARGLGANDQYDTPPYDIPTSAS
jgi:hypothetical protein